MNVEQHSDAYYDRIAELETENARLQQRLDQAEAEHNAIQALADELAAEHLRDRDFIHNLKSQLALYPD